MRKTFHLFALLLLFVSCETDHYDTGDGKYSYLNADFGEVQTVAANEIATAVTDEGVSLVFQPHVNSSWAVKADTTYRALIYYNKVENGVTNAYAISQVPVVKALITERPDTVKTDPLTFESAWISQNGKYLNIGFAVKTGIADGIDALQRIGIWQTALETDTEGTRHLYLRMTHSQNGVPEYYSSRGFLSLPLADFEDCQIHLSVNTYQGEVVKIL